jgi:hypothetical protein
MTCDPIRRDRSRVGQMEAQATHTDSSPPLSPTPPKVYVIRVRAVPGVDPTLALRAWLKAGQ